MRPPRKELVTLEALLVRELLGELTWRPAEFISTTDTLEANLGLRTVDRILLVHQVKQRLGVELPLDALENLATVEDVVTVVAACPRRGGCSS